MEMICPLEHVKDDEWIKYVNDKLTIDAIASRDWRERAGDINNAIVHVRDIQEQKFPCYIIPLTGQFGAIPLLGVVPFGGRAVRFMNGQHVSMVDPVPIDQSARLWKMH